MRQQAAQGDLGAVGDAGRLTSLKYGFFGIRSTVPRLFSGTASVRESSFAGGGPARSFSVPSFSSAGRRFSALASSWWPSPWSDTAAG